MFSVLADDSSTGSPHHSRRSHTSMRAPRSKTTAKKRQSKKEKERQRLQQRRLESGDQSEEAPNVTSETAEQAQMGSLQRQAEETKAPELPNPGTGEEFKEEEQTVARMPHNLDLTSESAYLQSTKTTNDLMDKLMQQFNLKMPGDLFYHIRWVMHMPQEVIDCLNTCLLIS